MHCKEWTSDCFVQVCEHMGLFKLAVRRLNHAGCGDSLHLFFATITCLLVLEPIHLKTLFTFYALAYPLPESFPRSILLHRKHCTQAQRMVQLHLSKVDEKLQSLEQLEKVGLSALSCQCMVSH
jgi:hypothetical protein